MKTLSLKFWLILISLSLIFIVGWHKQVSHQFVDSSSQVIGVDVEKPFSLEKQNKNSGKVKAIHTLKTSLDKKKLRPKSDLNISYRPAPEILRETYVQDNLEISLDEDWDEEAYIAEQNEMEAMMTKEERDAQETIYALENQLMAESQDFEQDDVLYFQIKQFFQDMDEASTSRFTLLDLQCSNAVCRISVKVPDVSSQYELIEDRLNELAWFEQSYADIKVNPDDSRFVIIYLSKAYQSK